MRSLTLSLTGLLMLCFGTVHAAVPTYHYTAITIPETSPQKEALRSGAWMRAMEASLAPYEFGHQPRTLSVRELKNYLIVLLTGALLVTLAALHLRSRRRSEMMVRAGERDFSIIPPANDRRKHPR